jgi:hypothetical protein
VVGPVQPEPPHCPYLVAVATLGTAEAVADAEEAGHAELLLLLAVLMMVEREEGLADDETATDALTTVESDDGVETTAFTVETEV